MNKQARVITGMYQNISINLLIGKLHIVPAKMMLDYCKQEYAFQLFILSNKYGINDILPISLKIFNRNAQPRDQQWGDAIWATYQKTKDYRQHLARSVSVCFYIDPVEEVELVINL